MNRREFVAKLSRLAALPLLTWGSGSWLIGCGASGSGDSGNQDNSDIPMQLATELKPLADPYYQEYAASFESADLYRSLQGKGVLSTEGKLHPEVVTDLAQTDPLAEFAGFYYVESELQLYALAILLNPASGADA